MRGSAPTTASEVRSSATAEAWRQSAAYRHLEQAFAGLSADDPRALTTAAKRVLADTNWLIALLDPLIAASACDPWFELPFRVNRDQSRTGAVLFARPGVALTLSLVRAAAIRPDPPKTVICSGRLTITRYLRAGRASLARWRADRLPLPLTANLVAPCRRLSNRTPADGEILRHDGRRGADVIVAADADVVMLSASLTAGCDPVAREFDAVTGQFLRMATNDEGAARAQLLLGLLRAADRCDPAIFDAATRDDTFFLRWTAMREWLRGDWRAAIPRLTEMARSDPHPDVHAAAAATLAGLAPELRAH